MLRFAYHVDDGTYAQVGERLWSWYLSELGKYLEYTIKALDYCLGIQFHIDYDTGIVHMEQSAQVEKMLRSFGLESETLVWYMTGWVSCSTTFWLSQQTPINSELKVST